MTREEVLKDLESRFKQETKDFFRKSEKRLYMEIDPDSIVKIATYVFKDLGARFSIASGIDIGGNFEILYHFTLETVDLIISLRVKIHKDKPEIDSLAPVFEGANWIEREMFELLGIKFKGHPNLKRLLLSDQWPEGVYPLRQDYKEWDKTAIRDRGV